MTEQSKSLAECVRRQMDWSERTFGPGDRTKGTVDHVRKELQELLDDPDDGERAKEWVDVIILGLDGLWRALEADGHEKAVIPELAEISLTQKQSKNENRTWPDWRKFSKDEAIEHDRTGE